MDKEEVIKLIQWAKAHDYSVSCEYCSYATTQKNITQDINQFVDAVLSKAVDDVLNSSFSNYSRTIFMIRKCFQLDKEDYEPICYGLTTERKTVIQLCAEPVYKYIPKDDIEKAAAYLKHGDHTFKPEPDDYKFSLRFYNLVFDPESDYCKLGVDEYTTIENYNEDILNEFDKMNESVYNEYQKFAKTRKIKNIGIDEFDEKEKCTDDNSES